MVINLREKIEKRKKHFLKSIIILKDVIVEITLQKPDTLEAFTVPALLDSGATGLFINQNFAEKNGV